MFDFMYKRCMRKYLVLLYGKLVAKSKGLVLCVNILPEEVTMQGLEGLCNNSTDTTCVYICTCT